VPTLGLAHNLLLTREQVSAPAAGSTSRRLKRQAPTSSSASTSRRAAPTRRPNRCQGGNLQKFIVGREIDANPKLLIVSQPTWGVDVGAAAQIRGEILALRDAGCAVLVVSEELDELFEVSDRLHVIAKGQTVALDQPRLTPP
jgi:ABC-type uncharacterized transport system ATPase subunit